MMYQVERISGRSFFMGNRPFGQPRPVLGQAWIVSTITGILQAIPAAAGVYQAKRAADRAKQERSRQNEAERAQAASDAAAQEQAKAQAQEQAKAQALEQQQGLTPQGIPIQTNKVLGVDPIVLAVGGIGIIGIGAVLFMALKK